jgi:hypothetical protein
MDQKKYEGTIRSMLPGHPKEVECRVHVSADNILDAAARIEVEWKKITVLQDVRVKLLSPKKYEGTIRLTLSKEVEVKIHVTADNTTVANAKIEEEWEKIVVLRDVRVKEVEKVMTAS